MTTNENYVRKGVLLAMVGTAAYALARKANMVVTPCVSSFYRVSGTESGLRKLFVPCQPGSKFYTGNGNAAFCSSFNHLKVL